jgi:hypothetical protein
MEPKFMIFVVAAALLVSFIARTSIFDVYGATPTTPTQHPTDTRYTKWKGLDDKLYSTVCITQFTPKSEILSAKCLTCELDKKTLKQTNCPGGFKSIIPQNPKDLSCIKYREQKAGKYYGPYYLGCQIKQLSPDGSSTSIMQQTCVLDNKGLKKISCNGYEQVFPAG